MRRLFACMLAAALLGSAQAEEARPPGAPDTAPAALQALPKRMGYAVDKPEILIRQRLFGLAHGLSLLAAACLDLPEHSGPIEDAYAIWHARQGKTIETLVQDLARYYFGSRAPEAEWLDLARALKLSDNIQPALRDVSLPDACASLPAAIGRPRYELDRLLAEEAGPVISRAPAAAMPHAATSSVAPPAPTAEKPAE